ncbi:MAG: sulfurtransferase [Woeseiaceae bacterium]
MNNQDILVTAEQLAAAGKDPCLRVLDCRFNLLDVNAGRAAYQAAHIPGAVYVDLNRDLAAPVRPDSGRHPLPDAATAAATFGRLGVGNDSNVVLYDDQGGAIAARAWWMLRWLGHENVRLLDGGLAAWVAANFALQQGAFEVPENTFEARVQSGWTITVDELTTMGGDSLRLVDARAAARFEGELEPVDTLAGHVPGAVNLPFEHCLEPDGRWRPVEDLRKLWQDVFATGMEAPWSVMCGSGVTACHLAISAELAEISRPRLYVGSWSEWIRDPARGVASGPG